MISQEPVALFYSYCHTDRNYRQRMETSLALLTRNGYIRGWSDTAILPGRSISSTIDPQIDGSHILAYLLSPDFIRSEACVREWERGRSMAHSHHTVYRIPIIIRPCPWQDFLGDDDVLALPTDGIAISTFANQDEAWLQVYDGIKRVAEQIRMCASAKSQSQYGSPHE